MCTSRPCTFYITFGRFRRRKQVKSRRLMRAAVLCALCAGPAEAQTLPDVEELLAPRHVEVELIEPRLHPDAQRLMDKMLDWHRDDPNWLTEYVARTRRARNARFAPVFGLTEREFDRFWALQDSGSTVVLGRAELEIRETGSGVTLILSGIPELNGLRIDFTTWIVQTQKLNLEVREEVHESAASDPIGAWDGYRWSRTVSDPNSDDFVLERVTIGQFQDSGQSVITYSLRERMGLVRSLVDRTIRFR